MPAYLISDSPASSGIALALGSGATSAVVGAAAGFSASASTVLAIPAIITDTGNPSYSAANPLATPFEGVWVTGVNAGTNTLTLVRGQFGTTAKSFFAGSTITANVWTQVMAQLKGMSCRAFLAGAQSTPSGTANTKVALDTVGGATAAGANSSYDPWAMFSAATHAIVAPVAGFYECYGAVSAQLNSNPQTFQANLVINAAAGTGGSAYLLRGGGAGDPMTSVVAEKLIWLNAADSVFLFIATVGSNATGLVTGAINTFLSVAFVRT